MENYSIRVIKRTYSHGEVSVVANSFSEAVEMVEQKITNGELQTTNVKWDEPIYEDNSFETDSEWVSLQLMDMVSFGI